MTPCALKSMRRLLEAIRRLRGGAFEENTFKWLHSKVGLPCFLDVEDRPRMHWTCARPAGRQAVAADPEIVLAVEEEWSRRVLSLGVRKLAMAALFSWMCCMRFEHMERNILLRLSTEYLFGCCCWEQEQTQLLLLHAVLLSSGP